MADTVASAVEQNLTSQSTKGEEGLPHGGADAIASTAADGGHGAAPHVDPEALGLNATAWVALAMLVVIGIMIWKKVPAAIGRALDRKIEGIREQLAEAQQLRAEAEALKGEYEAKVASAEAEAATMIERARHEADMILEQARTDTAALMERRTGMAEAKIAAAERTALSEVRATAANAAAAAAARLISEQMDAQTDRAMVDRTIAGLG
jgi:F-type H+-transporting ATPase subunit b